MSNAVSTTWPSGSANAGWPQEPTGMLMPGRIQGWPAGTQRAANPATTLLSQAVAWWDVEQYRDGDRFLRNRGTGGELLDLRLGSSVVPNSNDPLFLAPEDSGYVYIPGVTGNRLSIPDEAGLGITGDLDLRIRCRLTSYASSSVQTFISKNDAGAGQYSYYFAITSGSVGYMRLIWSPNGTTASAVDKSSTAAPSVDNGQTYWFRVTLDVDNGAGAYEVKFYFAPDSPSEPTSWTQVGDTVVGGSTTSIYAGTMDLSVGARTSDGANAMTGAAYRAVVRNGIGGTVVADIDCDAITSGSATSFTAVTNQTVTVNRSTSGRKAVAVPSRHNGGRPVMLLGTDDWLEIPAENGWQHGLLNFGQEDSFTALIICRRFGSQSNQYLLSKNDGDFTPGYVISGGSTGTGGFVGDSATAALTTSNPTFTAGVAQMHGFVVNRQARTVQSFIGTARSAAVSTANVGPIRPTRRLGIGRSFGSFANLCDFEFYGAAILRGALTTAQLQLLADDATRRIA